MSDSDSRDKKQSYAVYNDDDLEVLLSELPSLLQPEDAVQDSPKAKKQKIIVPIEQYFSLTKPVIRFKRYFDLEGGGFPDLFPRYEGSIDDVDSKVDVVSPARAGKIYSNLLTAALREQTKKAGGFDEDGKAKSAHLTGELLDQLISVSGLSSSGSKKKDVL